ncbi:MAG: SSS family solute:Na+ symporter [Arenicella sp.]|jgi:SSS family solute:Na+ symporter
MASADWIIFLVYLAAVFIIGIIVSKKASTGIDSYFVADRSLPWWWLGISIIATTFAADTPLAITGITAKGGIVGNWFWWSWAATYITISIFFAKRWRSSQVLTDVEFIELRYSGKEAAFLRGFKAFFYGVVINIFILGWVITAAVKIAGPFISWEKILGTSTFEAIGNFYPSVLLFKGDLNATITIMALLIIVMIYSSIGGIRGVILTDLFQFVIAIVISIVFAFYAVDAVGGLEGLQTSLVDLYGEARANHLTEIIPSFDNPLIPFEIFIIYVVVQWWVRYDSDGSGYIAQRINTAKDENEARKGSLLFAISFIALRTWPWIMVALVSLVIFPVDYSVEMTPEMVGVRESYYPILMSTLLPVGLVGLAFTSLMAAFMSTVDTHLNWGASYLTNDIYRRFINPKAKQKQLIRFSKNCVVVITLLAVIVASQMDSISGAWVFFINAASGLGVAQLIRWFWWRANAWTEISSMLAAILATILYPVIFASYADVPHFDTYALVGITGFCLTVAIIVTFSTRPTSDEQLKKFIEKCKPVGLWRGEGISKDAIGSFSQSIIMWVLGLTTSFCGLFTIGYFLMLKPMYGVINAVVSVLSFIILTRMMRKERERED